MVAGLLALAILAQASIPVPTGVNGSVLGTADHFAFHGPGKVCLREASLDLDASETAYLKYSGIHSLKIEIRGPDGTLELDEGEAWANTRRQKTLLLKQGNMSVYEVDRDREFRYLVYGPNRYSEGKPVPMIWIDGTVLQGDHSDRKIVSRLSLGSPLSEQCGIAYNYGWGVLLEGEPMVTRKDNRAQ